MDVVSQCGGPKFDPTVVINFFSLFLTTILPIQRHKYALWTLVSVAGPDSSTVKSSASRS